jgi:hypothetical protein
VGNLDAPGEWRDRYDFHQATAKPLVEMGAKVHRRTRLEETDETEAFLVVRSIKESEVQFDSQGEGEK